MRESTQEHMTPSWLLSHMFAHTKDVAFASEHASKGSFPSHKSDNESVSTLGASVAQGPIVAPFNQKLQ